MTAFKYTFCAIIAITINLITQYLSFAIYSGYGALYLSMLIGTATGLIIKYILDKKYIFYDKMDNASEETQKFLLYSFIGGFTTVIFWGSEIVFDYLLQSNYGKYYGAVFGLSLGYLAKYYLDKKFVFRNN